MRSSSDRSCGWSTRPSYYLIFPATNAALRLNATMSVRSFLNWFFGSGVFGTDCFFERFRDVPKRVVAIEIIEDGNERVLLKTYDDASEDRVTIVRKARKKGRISNKIAWYRDLRTGRKIFY